MLKSIASIVAGRSRRVLAAVFLLGTAAMAWGQERPSGEVAAYTGIYHESGMTKAVIGGTGGAYVSDRVQILGDFGYVPVGSGWNMVMLGGGLHIQLGRLGSRVVPYVPMSLGFGRSWGYGGSSTAPYFGGGLGARCYVGKNWGIRPEFQYLRWQKSEGGWNSVRLTAGLFYQFGR